MDRRAFLQAGTLTIADTLLPHSSYDHLYAEIKPDIDAAIKPCIEFYVAPYGHDSNSGTMQAPFATIDRAKRAAREAKRNIVPAITVWVRGGTYYLQEPLLFTPADSGTPDAPVTYAAYGDELVTLSGGRKLQCQWKPYQGDILRCFLPHVKNGELTFTQLFIEGKRQIRARYPNYDAGNPLPDGEGYADATHLSEEWPPQKCHFDPTHFSPRRWKKPEKAVIHIFPRDYWGNLQWEVNNVDRTTGEITFGWGGFQLNEQLFGKAATGIGKSRIYSRDIRSRFFVENVFEELDAPGEWYLDSEDGMLYAIPEKGVDPSAMLVEAPVLEHVIEFRGSQRQPVRHIRLTGFRIAHTASTFLNTYEAPSLGDWTIHRGGAVFFDGTEDCAVENCFFDAVGGNGLFINNYNRRTRIYGNKFTLAGDSAICLVGSECQIQGTNRPLPSESLIANNLIHDCGVFGKQIAGVFLSTSEKNTISHNLIYNMPRAAICVNDGWGAGHVIEFNHIHNTVRETTDHGPFNSWGRGRFWCMEQSHGNASHASGYHDSDKNYPLSYPEADGYTSIIRNNLFREPHSVNQLGIDLDDGSSHYHIYNNVCVGISIKLREGDYRLVENNIFFKPSNPPAFHQGYEENHDRFLRNIIVTSSTLNRGFGKSSVSGDLYQVTLPPAKGPFIAEIDHNLFFNDLGDFYASMTLRGQSREHHNLEEWQAMGYDRHSVFANPEFIAPEQGNFNLNPESPALKLGFVPIDISAAGLLPDFSKRWRE